MKKLITILLAIVLTFSLGAAAFAADQEEIAAADVLYTLGLFKGTGTDAEGKPVYDLDRAPNRAEAVTMLVRLLGKEAEAQAGTWEIPFTDVADWAKPYVGYAYANGLTNGYDEKTFGGTDPVTAAQYLTFVLRALGYSSAEDGDFRWDAAWELTDRLQITRGEYGADTPFDRGDAVKVSYAALGAYLKGEGRFLGEKLLDEGVFTLEQYHAAMSGGSGEEDGQNPVMNFVGTYVYGRASATVACEGTDSARIEIAWSSSYAERTVWEIVGVLDPETLTVSYSGAVKKNQVFDENGLVSEETLYTDGTGTIVFREDGTFTWHEDQAEQDDTYTFEWVNIVPPEEDGQNPVMNFVGEYQCGRAGAMVECGEGSSAIIHIHWSGSAWEYAQWVIVGELDTETLTIRYTDCIKTIVTMNDQGLIDTEETVYEDGTGTIVFNEDGTFTWHEDQSEYDEDYTFEWIPVVPPEEDGQNPVMNWIGDYRCEKAQRARAHVVCSGSDSALITITWSGSVSEYAEWVIEGVLDLETLTIRYTDCIKEYITVDSNGEVVKEDVVYDNGTGTIVFDEGLSFTWHEDQSETGDELVFEWALGD